MNKSILITIVVMVIIGISIWFGFQLSPGAYVDAEEYEFNMDEQSLIKTIQNFKTKYPEFNVPSQVGTVDGKNNTSNYLYHIYFYYSKENKIIKTWVRSDGSNKSTMAFVAINKGLALGKWKFINKDFSGKENKEEKRKFEERILNNLK